MRSRSLVLLAATSTLLLLLAVLASGCSKEARQAAEFTAFYSVLGMELGQVEQTGYGPLAAKLGDAHKHPKQRKALIAGFNKLVDDIEAVVKRHTPDDPANHVGYQAAMQMVSKRRAAVAEMDKTWAALKDPMKDVHIPIRFGDAWMKAGFEFQNKVGELSQRVFGDAAQKAQDGALEQLKKAQPTE